ncbi:MAG: hypothetical protein ABI629_11015 [bacterium]
MQATAIIPQLRTTDLDASIRLAITKTSRRGSTRGLVAENGLLRQARFR